MIVAALVFGEFHSRQVYLSLVPISLGIFLASVSDFSYNHTGFFIAVLSALAKVLPVLEDMGLSALVEEGFAIEPRDASGHAAECRDDRERRRIADDDPALARLQ